MGIKWFRNFHFYFAVTVTLFWDKVKTDSYVASSPGGLFFGILRVPFKSSVTVACDSSVLRIDFKPPFLNSYHHWPDSLCHPHNQSSELLYRCLHLPDITGTLDQYSLNDGVTHLIWFITKNKIHLPTWRIAIIWLMFTF